MVEIARDRTLDGLKFLLIMLVIIGHAIEPSRYSCSFSGILYSVIYSFHMPLFVMLSGMFTKNLNLAKLNRQALTLMETYLVMAILMGILLGKGLRLVVDPSLSCWYILSLICWRYMLYWLVEKRKCKTGKLIFYSVIILIVSFSLPVKHGLGLLSLMRTCQFFIFFVIGYCISEELISFLRKSNLHKIGLWIVTVVCFCVIGLYSSRELHVLEFHRDTMFSLVESFNCTPVLTMFYKCLILIVALIVSFTFMSIGKYPKAFEKYGRNTLSFFFLQGILVHKLVQVLPHNIYVELLAAGGITLLGGGNLQQNIMGHEPNINGFELHKSI